MTIYYVSSEIGSNNNAGTSQNAPLASSSRRPRTS